MLLELDCGSTAVKAVLFDAEGRRILAASTRQQYRRRLDRDLDAIMALCPTNEHGQRLRKCNGKVRGDLFTFLIHSDTSPASPASHSGVDAYTDIFNRLCGS